MLVAALELWIPVSSSFSSSDDIMLLEGDDEEEWFLKSWNRRSEKDAPPEELNTEDTRWC
jgi:hypothetical protein